MSVDYILVFVAVGNSSEAKAIAHKLVEQREAACVGILKQNSIYRWEGKNIEDDEYLLTIKTTRGQFAAIQDTVLSMHSYDVPEIIGVDITEGYMKYLEWLGECVSSVGISRNKSKN